MRRSAYIDYDAPVQGSSDVRTKRVERVARYGAPITVGVCADYEDRVELTLYRDGRIELVRRRTAERPTETLYEGSIT